MHRMDARTGVEQLFPHLEITYGVEVAQPQELAAAIAARARTAFLVG